MSPRLTSILRTRVPGNIDAGASNFRYRLRKASSRWTSARAA